MPGRQRVDAALRLAAFLALATPLLCLLGVSFVVTPADIDSGAVAISPGCLLVRAFGVECPVCGMTRAFAALGHGQLRLAFELNHGAPVVYLLVWALLLYAVRGAIGAFRWRTA